MIETFLILLTSHLLGDFVFQPTSLFRRKQRLVGIVQHVAIIALLTTLVLAPASIRAAGPILIVVGAHFLMDIIKAWKLGDKLWAFALDQGVHLAVIAAVAAMWPGTMRQTLWGLCASSTQAFIYAGMALVCGAIIGVAVGGIVIKKLVTPLAPEKQTGGTPITGMPSAGLYIGWLERALTIAFILAKQPEGVGFLLAAKSILRFRDVQNEADRHQAEYVIIGTFLSFGWALLTGFLTQAAISHWLPG